LRRPSFSIGVTCQRQMQHESHASGSRRDLSTKCGWFVVCVLMSTTLRCTRQTCMTCRCMHLPDFSPVKNCNIISRRTPLVAPHFAHAVHFRTVHHRLGAWHGE
jgi:hypothetical protein